MSPSYLVECAMSAFLTIQVCPQDPPAQWVAALQSPIVVRASGHCSASRLVVLGMKRTCALIVGSFHAMDEALDDIAITLVGVSRADAGQ